MVMTKTSQTAKIDAKIRGLFLLSADGCSESYREFLEEIEQLLIRFYGKKCFKFSEADVEELCQEALLKIHRFKSSYDISYPITPWIYAIAKNIANDRFKEFKKNSEVKSSLRIEEVIDSFEVNIAFKQELESLLCKLSDNQKYVLQLSKGLGFTNSEVSSKTGMGVSAIKVSIHRSLKLLRSKGRKNEK
jgi:RNA polymerase sigma-70 factor (ECF subfamily)